MKLDVCSKAVVGMFVYLIKADVEKGNVKEVYLYFTCMKKVKKGQNIDATMSHDRSCKEGLRLVSVISYMRHLLRRLETVKAISDWNLHWC